LEVGLKQAAEVLIIIDDQNARAGVCSGAGLLFSVRGHRFIHKVARGGEKSAKLTLP
jgi:hypothetical protein